MFTIWNETAYEESRIPSVSVFTDETPEEFPHGITKIKKRQVRYESHVLSKFNPAQYFPSHLIDVSRLSTWHEKKEVISKKM